MTNYPVIKTEQFRDIVNPEYHFTTGTPKSNIPYLLKTAEQSLTEWFNNHRNCHLITITNYEDNNFGTILTAYYQEV